MSSSCSRSRPRAARPLALLTSPPLLHPSTLTTMTPSPLLPSWRSSSMSPRCQRTAPDWTAAAAGGGAEGELRAGGARRCCRSTSRARASARRVVAASARWDRSGGVEGEQRANKAGWGGCGGGRDLEEEEDTEREMVLGKKRGSRSWHSREERLEAAWSSAAHCSQRRPEPCCALCQKHMLLLLRYAAKTEIKFYLATMWTSVCIIWKDRILR